MKILYLGDIMGEPGRRVVKKLLPRVRIQYDVDVVLAQSENVTHGKGISTTHFRELEEAGIDGFTGGNHSFERKDNVELALKTRTPLVVPANIRGKTLNNYKLIRTREGFVAFASIQGYIAPKGYDEETTENPLFTVDNLLHTINENRPIATIINIHSEFSSEKVVMGHYLDGRVAAVIGDHWHVPTADARVLPNGTAHVTDVGMCGALNSSIGFELEVAYERWKGGKVRSRMELGPPWQLCAVLVEVNPVTGFAISIKQIIINTHRL